MRALLARPRTPGPAQMDHFWLTRKGWEAAGFSVPPTSEELLRDAIDLLCQIGLGVDMGTTAPVSDALRDALARRYQERESGPTGSGQGMTIEDWRWCIDQELDTAREP